MEEKQSGNREENDEEKGGTKIALGGRNSGFLWEFGVESHGWEWRRRKGDGKWRRWSVFLGLNSMEIVFGRKVWGKVGSWARTEAKWK